MRAPIFPVDDYTYPVDAQLLLIGQTGCGKTFLAKRLLDRVYDQVPIVVYQSKPRVVSLDRLVVDRVSTMDSLAGILSRRTPSPMVIFKPPPILAANRLITEEFCQTVFTARGPRVVYIDECSLFTSYSPLPATWFATLLTQGRELGICRILALQEPAWAPRMVYAESSVVFKFRTFGLANAKALRDKLPEPVAMMRVPSDPHAFVAWDARWPDEAHAYTRCL